jgi:hypothetical protein
MRASKGQVACTVATVILVVAGLVLFAGSWLARYELQQATDEAIINAIIIDSPVRRRLSPLHPPPFPCTPSAPR